MNLTESYFTTTLDCFPEDKEIPFDVFIKIVSGGMLKFINKTDLPFKSVSDQNKINESSKVYIQDKDMQIYLNFILSNISDINKSTTSDISQIRAKKVIKVLKDIHVSLNRQGVNKENLNLLKRLSVETIRSLKLERSNFSFIRTLMKNESSLRYTLAKTAYAVLICEHLEWKTEATLSKIAIAGFLSDIGLSPRFELALTPISQMNEEENKFYLGHTRRSYNLLNTSSSVSTEILQTILHHHEYCDGSGPLSLSKNYIYPLAQILRVSEEFVNLVFSNPYNITPSTVVSGLNQLREDRRLNNQFVTALSKALTKTNF